MKPLTRMNKTANSESVEAVQWLERRDYDVDTRVDESIIMIKEALIKPCCDTTALLYAVTHYSGFQPVLRQEIRDLINGV